MAGEWQVSEWAYLFPLSTCSQAPSPIVQVSTTLSTPCSGTGALRMLEHHLQPRPALFSKQFLGDLASWGAGQPWVDHPAQPSPPRVARKWVGNKLALPRDLCRRMVSHKPHYQGRSWCFLEKPNSLFLQALALCTRIFPANNT